MPDTMQIIILGSCVSRDPFNEEIEYKAKEDLNVKRLFARTTLISLNSPSMEIDLSEIEGLTPFECRYVHNDLNKEFYKYLDSRDLSNTYLLLDFIDERMDILQWQEHYITMSNEFRWSNMPGKFEGTVWQRLSPETMELWRESCRVFTEKIKAYYPPERIILHRAFWLSGYWDQGEKKLFENQEEIALQNSILEGYYEYFEARMPGIHIIDLNDNGYLADSAHRWGLQPFHYETKYYQHFLACLDRIRLQNGSTETRPAEL